GAVKRGGKVGIALDLELILKKDADLVCVLADLRNSLSHGARNLGKSIPVLISDLGHDMRKVLRKKYEEWFDAEDLPNDPIGALWDRKPRFALLVALVIFLGRMHHVAALEVE